MLALVISLLLNEVLAAKMNVTRDKKNDKKSIEVLMESDDRKNLNSNESEINRLVINSTYDDSIFISTYMKQGVNITVIQDRKSIVDVTKKNGENVTNMESADDEIEVLEEKANKLVTNEIILAPKAMEETEDLLRKVFDIGKLKTAQKERRRLRNLELKLFMNQKRLQQNLRVKKLTNILEESLVQSNFTDAQLMSFEAAAKELKFLISKKFNVGSTTIARKVLELYDSTTSNLNKFFPAIERISTNIRQNHYTFENVSDLNQYLNELNKLQPTLQTKFQQNIVSSLKLEVVKFIEAVNVINTVEKILQNNPASTGMATNNFKRWQEALRIVEMLRNDKIRSKAKNLSMQLYHMQANERDSVEKLNWIKILDAINQTLVKSNAGFGGKAGLKQIEIKLKNDVEKIKDNEVRMKAHSLLASVKSYQDKIDDVSELLSKIDKNVSVPNNEGEVDKLGESINTIKNLTKTVNDPSVSIKSQTLINKIRKVIEDYGMQKQINSINLVLQNMNQSLEKAETGDDIRKDEKKLNLLEIAVKKKHDEKAQPVPRGDFEKILNSIDIMKRSIPVKSKKIEIKNEAKQLLKIVNGYLQDVMPEMKEKLRQVETNYETLRKLNRNDLDTGSLKDRIDIASKDFNRIMNGLQSIKNRLKEFDFSDDERNEVIKFKSTQHTTEKLYRLDRLFNEPKRQNMVKNTLMLIQTVNHTNDMLKQLQAMITFNSNLLKTNDKRGETTDKAKIVPVSRISVLPLVAIEPGKAKVEKSATKATDLDKMTGKGSSINSSGLIPNDEAE